MNGRFVPNLVQSAQAGTFGAGFSGYRGPENGGTFGAGFGTKRKQEQPKQEKPKEGKPKKKHPKEETPKGKQKKSRSQREKPKTWAQGETEFVEPEKEPKKEHAAMENTTTRIWQAR